MKQEHTPGPWTAGLDEYFFNKYKAGQRSERWKVEAGDDDVLIATMWAPEEFRNTTTAAETVANAHLISAAPDLLEALIICRNATILTDEDIAKVDAAIAKASPHAH